MVTKRLAARWIYRFDLLTTDEALRPEMQLLGDDRQPTEAAEYLRTLNRGSAPEATEAIDAPQ